MITRSAFGALAAASLLLTGASDAQTFGEAIDQTKFMVNWRVRYEGVDQDGLAEDADAMTSRIRAGFQTGEAGGTSLLGELVYVAHVMDDFNSTLNGQTQFPVVADPDEIASTDLR
jgi:hypothetical protein